MQSLSSQLFAFSVTVVGGLIIGLLFDFYRVGRGVIKPKKIITHVGDLIFWLASTALIFLFLLLGNWGEIRFYVFLGLFLGVTFYLKLFSNWVIKIVLRTLRLIRTIKLQLVRMVLFLYRVISYPFRVVGQVVLIPIGLVGGFWISTRTRARQLWIKLKLSLKKAPPPE